MDSADGRKGRVMGITEVKINYTMAAVCKFKELQPGEWFSWQGHLFQCSQDGAWNIHLAKEARIEPEQTVQPHTKVTLQVL